MAADQAQAQVAWIMRGVLDDDARRAYETLRGFKTDTTAGLGSVDAQLDGAELFNVVVDGQITARYALKTFTRANGTEVCIVGAVGRLPGVDLVESIMPAIEQQCAQADCMMINTRRRGLAKKLARQGWKIDAFVMRKRLKK